MNELIDLCLAAQLMKQKVTLLTTTREYTGFVLAATVNGITLVNPFIVDVGVSGKQCFYQDFFVPLAHIEGAGAMTGP